MIEIKVAVTVIITNTRFWSENCLKLNFPCFRAARRIRMSNTDFYLRYYVGHKGKFGHEFLEFEFRPDGKLR